MTATQTRRLHGGDASVDAAADGVRAIPTNQPQPGASLGELVRFFFTRPSPLIIASGFLVAFVARLFVGRWGAWDVAIPVIIVVLEPFTEWVIHVRILHRKPRTLGRFTIDSLTARGHRAHHRNPKDLRVLMVPGSSLLVMIPLIVTPVALFVNPPQAAMALASGFGMLLWYEWVHYLIHAPYRPTTKWFRNLSRNHVLHHFKNEHYWFGVTVSFGDRVLGTRPDEKTVELSPTVRNLSIER